MRRYLLSIFRSHIPSIPNAQKQYNNNNAAAKKSKKQNYLHPFTGIRNQNNQSTSPRPNPDIKPRHDLAVSESKTDRNPVYVGQNRFRDPRKIINQSKTPLSCISHPDRLSWPPFFVEDGNPTASYFFFANEQSRYTKPAQ
jgi:hypothetical protein